jgi:hypothetical protein
VTVTVAVVGDDPSAFAQMLGGLIEANLLRSPDRARLLRPAIVELEALDAGTLATVRLHPLRVEVHDGRGHGRAELRIRAMGRDLLELAAAPLRFGLPDPLRAEGRAMLGAVASGRVRVEGVAVHPLVLSRFARLLSASR